MYELVAWFVSLGQWSRWRQVALNYMHHGTTLELGYGTGVFFQQMMEQGLNPIGVDISPFMAGITYRRLHSHNLSCQVVQTCAESLPFPDSYFNNIVATFPTNYILQPATLAEIHRTSRGNAVLIIVTRGELVAPEPIKIFIAWLHQITGKHNDEVVDLHNCFAQSGFKMESLIGEFQGAKAQLIIAHKIDLIIGAKKLAFSCQSKL